MDLGAIFKGLIVITVVGVAISLVTGFGTMGYNFFVNYPLPKGEGASEVITPTNVGSSFRFLSLRPTDK